MKKSLSAAIITLLSLILVVGIAILILLLRGDESEEPAVQGEPAATSSEQTTTSTTSEPPDIDPVALLEDNGINTVHPAPAPDAPGEWGDYKLRRSWDGMARVFESSDATAITDDGGTPFPATMNRCGVAMYLVTFKSTNPDVDISAVLVDAAGGTAAEESINQGWSLSTNCETPAYRFLGSRDISNLGDVVYTVHEYIQSSTSAGEPQSASAADQAATPTLVECLGYLGPARGLYSDGVERLAAECGGQS